MARINLLPWRQEERERRNKDFLMQALLAGLLTVVLLGLVWFLYDRDLSNQLAANQYIETENARLEKVMADIQTLESQREEMLSRLKVIQDLQGKRSIPVRIWDDLARAIPSSLFLTSLKREGDVITISGFADNANEVSSLIRNLDASPWLDGSTVANMQRNIESYQSNGTADSSGNPADGNANVRQAYPEDHYLRFTITTRVVTTLPTTTDGTNTATDTELKPMPTDGAVGSPTTSAPSTPAPAQPATPSASNTAPSADSNAATSNAPAPAADAPPVTQTPAGGQ